LKVKKLTSADVVNIIMAVIGLVGLKRAPECIKMHHFEGENSKIFIIHNVNYVNQKLEMFIISHHRLIIIISYKAAYGQLHV